MYALILQTLAPLCAKLVWMSCAATLIGASLLLLRYFFDQKIPPLWKHALWCLVLIALLVPYRIPSSMAVFPSSASVAFSELTTTTQMKPENQSQTHPQTSTQINPQTSNQMQTAPGLSDTQASTAPSNDLAAVTNATLLTLVCTLIFPSIWLLGVIFFVLYWSLSQWYLRHRLTTTHKACTLQTQQLFVQSQKILHITQLIPIVTQDYIQTPAVLGLFHPIVVLPQYAEDFPPETLRFVLLHELSHVKRKDLWYHTLLLILQTLYWFNPAIWVMFRFMRQDIELCNDSAVLRTLGQNAQKSYATSLLAVLGQYNRIPFAPRLLCMADGKHNIKRRIQMMQSDKHFRKNRIAIAVGCLLVIGVLVGLFLTKPIETNSNSTNSSTANSSSIGTSQANDQTPDDISASASSTASSEAKDDTSSSATDSTNSDATSSSTSTTPPTPMPTTIVMTLEGMKEEIDALRYEKSGYSIAIPTDEWTENSENTWQAAQNETVHFTILQLEESSSATVATTHWGEAGEESSWLDMDARFFNSDDNQTHILISLGKHANTAYYMLAECPAEAIEGYGTRMAYIAANISFTHASSRSLVSFADGLSDDTYTVFDSYSINDDNTLDASFCISDAAGNEIQTIAYPTHFDQSWYNTYLDNGGVIVRFLDVNCDGHLDFIGQVFGAMVNQSYQVWLYQEDSAQFAYSEEYSEQTNPVYNPQDKLFFTTSYYELGLPFYCLFHVERGHLAYLGSVQGALTDDGNVEYIERMYGERTDDGSITYREVQTMKDVTAPEECSPLWDGFPLILDTD